MWLTMTALKGWSVPERTPCRLSSAGDAGLGVVVEEAVDVGDHFGGCAAYLAGRRTDSEVEGGGLAGFEANPDGDLLVVAS